ncbi:DUF5691 domain-containing protein [Deminuibacter soli]|uniref:Uncharacterized protein n=1 Tax=Deminuibacter soli TaxID=2291815 RepID=A0A3E1NQD6_9BACT|nr:DUF5691 domain-containing protein [Deminuibacter soli]RFM30117.1 hypothetical protein DXN05_03850 [Deminuibacter soli]
MQTWNNLVNIALLGTGKRSAGAADLLPVLQPLWQSIQQQQEDETDGFLQLAALTATIRQAGVQPVAVDAVSFAEAGPEEKNYCSAQATQLLKQVLDEDSVPLLEYWLIQCAAKTQLVWPEFLPGLLNLAVKEKRLRELVVQCSGERGAWLASLNTEWQYFITEDMETVWQTGTLEQRKQVLRNMRSTDAATAREWLIQTWPQENAATRADLLSFMSVNAGTDDIAWLQSLLTEKSQKVKEEAARLLKRIPGSPVILQYQQALQQVVNLNKTAGTIQFVMPAQWEGALFKTGIDKLSNRKELSDNAYIMDQLIEAVPPVFWEQLWSASPQQIITWFQQREESLQHVRALVIATRRFNDQRWALALAQYSQVFYLDLLSVLPAVEQDASCIQYFASDPDYVLRAAAGFERKWSLELTKVIFTHVAKQPYLYNRTFFQQHIRHIPESVLPLLAQLAPKEAYAARVWQQTSAFVVRLVSLKEQTIRVFHQ